MCIRASFRRLFGRAAHLLDLGVHRLDEIGADLPRVLVRDPPHRRAHPLELLGRDLRPLPPPPPSAPRPAGGSRSNAAGAISVTSTPSFLRNSSASASFSCDT